MDLSKSLSHVIMKYLVVPKAPKPLEGKKKIACVGDSITYGAGVRKNHSVSTWAYHLEQKLGDDWQVLNYGISGRTLQAEGDYPYTAEKFYILSRAALADIYLIMLGTNDAKPYNWNEERYARELPAFVESFVKLPNRPRVILMTPPSCFAEEKTGVVGFDIDPAQIDGPIYEIVRSTAEEKKLPCIDLHAFTAGHPEWFDDGVHPNYEGNRVLAEHLFAAIRSYI